jgi:peroxiredoxin
MVLMDSGKSNKDFEAKDFELKDTDGSIKSLGDFKDKKGLLIVFTCNHCPYAKASWPVLVDLHAKYGDDIRFVAINPNDSDTYPEDSFETMQKRVKDWNVKFPYLRDKTQEVAKAYNAQCTPDPFLFKNDNGKFKLYYHGRIVSDWQNPEASEEHNLKDALRDLLTNKPSPSNQPPAMGCSIKWLD